MKKISSLILLISLCVSQFQIAGVYASEAQNLKNEKQKSVQILDSVEEIVANTVESLDKKIESIEKREKLQGKNKEIKAYLQKVENEIQKEKSTQNIQDRIEEAKK